MWKCNSARITSIELAATLVLPSVPRRQKSCTSLHSEICINDRFVNDRQFKTIDYSTYLGSPLTRKTNIDVEVNKRLFKANSICLWQIRKESVVISQNTKLYNGNTGCGANQAVLCIIVMDSVKPVTPENLNTSIQHFANYTEHQVARHGFRYRSHHTSRHPSHTFILQKVLVRWACYVTRMPDD